jgi:hypothetical protein
LFSSCFIIIEKNSLFKLSVNWNINTQIIMCRLLIRFDWLWYSFLIVNLFFKLSCLWNIFCWVAPSELICALKTVLFIEIDQHKIPPCTLLCNVMFNIFLMYHLLTLKRPLPLFTFNKNYFWRIIFERLHIWNISSTHPSF